MRRYQEKIFTKKSCALLWAAAFSFSSHAIFSSDVQVQSTAEELSSSVESETSAEVAGDSNRRTVHKLALGLGRALTLAFAGISEYVVVGEIEVKNNKHVKKALGQIHNVKDRIRKKKRKHYGNYSYTKISGFTFTADHLSYRVNWSDKQISMRKSFLDGGAFLDCDLANVSLHHTFLNWDEKFINVVFKKDTFHGARFVDQYQHWHRLNKHQAKAIFEANDGKIANKSMQELIDQMQTEDDILHHQESFLDE
jgi:hypothetical protein